MPTLQRERNMEAYSLVQKYSANDSGVRPRIAWRSKKVHVIGVIDEKLRTLIESIRIFLREDLEDFETDQ